MSSINKSLNPLDLELSRIRNELTGKDMYALVRRLSTIRSLYIWSNVERDPRSIAGTTKLRASRATTRPSKYPTFEHWYALYLLPVTLSFTVPTSRPRQVEQIMIAPNHSYSISSLAALREVNALTSPMTKTQAESVLASFVAKGWLLKSKCVPLL